MTIFARKVDTGEAVWAYQMTPFDQWDYDGVNENILVDMNVDGKTRKALVALRPQRLRLRARPHRRHAAARQQVRDRELGREDRPEDRPSGEGARALSARAWPQRLGLPVGDGRQGPAAGVRRSAEPNKFYVPTNNWCMELEPQERTHTQQGTVYVFANVYMYPEKPGITGKVKKFDVLTGKTEWEIPDPYPNWGGTLVTDGGLMFYGSLGGDFRAVDRKTGKVLWYRKLASGIIGNPITYKVKGKQYVSILAGIGGWIGVPVTAGLDLNDKFGAIGATAMTKAANLDKIPQAGTLFTFRVME